MTFWVVFAVSTKGDDVIGPLVFVDPETLAAEKFLRFHSARVNRMLSLSLFLREAFKYLHRAMNCASASLALRLQTGQPSS